MNIPTEEEYKAAIEVVKAYEANHEKLFQEKVVLIKKDLEDFFKDTYIESFQLETMNGSVIIYPTEPEFDEDYDGDLDKDLDAIGKKYGCSVGMDSGIYGK